MSESPVTQLLVLGAGPGGYTAAFRAADLGLSVTLVERHETLGGVCLNVGCIPSKALLHAAKVITDAERIADHGISFAAPQIDLDALRSWKGDLVGKLTGGLAAMAKMRGVSVVRGDARLLGPHEVEVAGQTISFEHAIIATGSRPVRLAGLPQSSPLVMDSTDALLLRDIPERLLVVGGGIIGLELATVYDALGSRVTIVELEGQLIPGCDADLVAPLQRRIAARYEAIHLGAAVASIEEKDGALTVGFTAASGDAPQDAQFDRALIAVGRTPNSDGIGLESAGVELGERGFVAVDRQLRTSAAHIHAIGDLVGPPMLAHKATHEARIAAEVIAGDDVEFDVHAIPSVAYTDPEIAWVGLTENEARRLHVETRTVKMPWSASGRALASDAQDGVTKLLVDPASGRVLGAGIVGEHAGELIAEIGLAIELESDTQDIALTVHAHPTLSESIAIAAEIAEGTVTDLPRARR